MGNNVVSFVRVPVTTLSLNTFLEVFIIKGISETFDLYIWSLQI